VAGSGFSFSFFFFKLKLSTWEAEIKRLWLEASLGKVSKMLSQKTSWAWRFMPVIPATQEVEVGGVI
jgi:hypothetical protein